MEKRKTLIILGSITVILIIFIGSLLIGQNRNQDTLSVLELEEKENIVEKDVLTTAEKETIKESIENEEENLELNKDEQGEQQEVVESEKEQEVDEKEEQKFFEQEEEQETVENEKELQDISENEQEEQEEVENNQEDILEQEQNNTEQENNYLTPAPKLSSEYEEAMANSDLTPDEIETIRRLVSEGKTFEQALKTIDPAYEVHYEPAPVAPTPVEPVTTPSSNGGNSNNTNGGSGSTQSDIEYNNDYYNSYGNITDEERQKRIDEALEYFSSGLSGDSDPINFDPGTLN